ncbi:synapsin-1-like [Aquila chrysaetos chrysaetos]|nr:synapsin-1-like [Aquila chrysaetos chrysaetos]
MHVARKGLEVQLGALPVPVQLSQQRAAQRQGRRVLPKLIRPGQSQPLRRCKLCPSLQGKADAIADNIRQKEVRRLWGDPNPTEESLALLVPCPPPLLAPLDPQLPREHSVWGPRAPGQASAAWHPRVGQQEPRSRHGSEESVHAPLPARPVSLAEQTSPRDLSVSSRHPGSSLAAGGGVCSSIQPPAVGNIVRESLLQPDGQLPQSEEFLWPLGLSLALPALPKLGSEAAGPAAAGPAAVLPEEDAGLQARFAATREAAALQGAAWQRGAIRASSARGGGRSGSAAGQQPAQHTPGSRTGTQHLPGPRQLPASLPRDAAPEQEAGPAGAGFWLSGHGP